MFPDLPVGIADPVERLENIRRQMDGLKESKMAVGGDSLVQMAGFAPPMLLALGTRLAGRVPQRSTRSPPTCRGRSYPLFILGRQMIEAYPFVPIFGSVRISIAIFSYLGGLNFGVTGDYDSAPDIEVLCEGIEAGVLEYLEIAGAVEAKEGATVNGPKNGARSRKRAASSNGRRTAARSRKAAAKS